MDKKQALPEPYAEVFIWWNNNGSVQRRVARLQADRKAFQLSTYLADTKGQYLASLDRVLRWEPIVSGAEFSMPDLSKADLAAAPAAPVAAQDELVAELLAALKACVLVMASDLPPSAAQAELAQAQAAIDRATGVAAAPVAAPAPSERERLNAIYRAALDAIVVEKIEEYKHPLGLCMTLQELAQDAIDAAAAPGAA